MYHEIGTPLERPARIAIEGLSLVVTAGHWPDFDGSVKVPAVSETLLETDAYVYLDRQGGIVLSDGFVPYGLDGANRPNELLDLLAWKVAGEWQIKRLVYEPEEAPNA